MTATNLSRELARKRPAQVVVRDAHEQVTAVLVVESDRRRTDVEWSPRPLTAGQLWFLRIGAVLLLAFAVVGLAVASIRTY